MTTLITGGTGFIGATVARLLLARGEPRPVVFDRNPSPQRLDDIADQVEIIQGDLGNFSHVLHAVERLRREAARAGRLGGRREQKVEEGEHPTFGAEVRS